MENLLLSLHVVLPLFLMMLLGVGLRLTKLVNETTLHTMNNVCFRTFLPLLLFDNLYRADVSAVLDPSLMFFTALAVIGMFTFTTLVIPLLEKDNRKRGVLVQAISRGNFIIFGMPITISLFGEGHTGTVALLSAIVIPLFNLLSVIVLERFRGEKIRWGVALKGIITNPLIIGSLAGILALLVSLRLPPIVARTLHDLAGVTTPLSLVILGASFVFQSIKRYRKQIVIGVVGKLLVIPAIFLGLAVACGHRGLALVALLAAFASPPAVSSFTMAQQMDADYDLAANLIVFCAALSVITIFLWIYLLKEFALI